MKADGSVIIDTKMNNNALEKGFERLKTDAESLGITCEKVGDQVKAAFADYDVSASIQNAVAKLQEAQNKLQTATDYFNDAVAMGDDKSAEAWARKREAAYARVEAAQRRLTQVIAAEANKQAAAEERAQIRATKAAEREAARKKKAQEKAYKDATKGARKFANRLSRILSGALIFNALSSGLQQLTSYFGTALKKNSEFAASFAQLKGAFLTAVQPIYEVVAPALIYLMNLLTKVMQAISRVFSLLTGKSTSQYAKNAKNLYEQASATEAVGDAAKEAKKQLMGFDEINRLDDNSNSSSGSTSGGISANFEQPEIPEVDLGKMISYTSGALLALGVLLAFSGVNIPLGLGLIAIGAAGLAAEITTNWDSMDGEVGKAISIVLGTLAAGGLVIGAILAFSGANVPLGIGLMVMGAAALGTAIGLNWNTIEQALQGPIGEIIAIVSGALLALGAILAFTGANLPLGIGLMVMGAAALATTAAVNWDTIGEKVKSVFAGVLSIISGASLVLGVLLCLSGAGLGLGLALIFAGLVGSKAAWSLSDNPVTRFVKNLANGVISIINSIASAINDLFHIKFNGLKIGGVQVIPSFNTQLMRLPTIPKLAQGAVLPANKPFLAMVGDQTHGTNVEAPLSTIQEAVAAVMGDMLPAVVAGFEAVVANQNEIRATVEGIEVGDSTIGAAAMRYQRRQNLVKGVG